MPSDAPPRRPLTILPTFLPSTSSSNGRSPHIRTPNSSSASGSSNSYFTTNFKNPTMSSSSSSASSRYSRVRIPRSVPSRILLAIIGIIGLFYLSRWTAGGGGVEEGVWDASSWSDRRGSGQGVGMGAMKKKFGFGGWTSTPGVRRPSLGGEVPNQKDAGIPLPKPNLSRQNISSPGGTGTERVQHPGKSRRVIVGSDPEKYTYGPLPNLDEAWAFLHPLLKKVKEETPAVPREHELTAPIFPPFLTEELKERFRHLRDDWDESKGEWVRGKERRWFLVTICRQVAGMLGDWFAAWTVLADFLGPESLVFSLLEGDSADGSGEILSGVMRAHLLHIGVPPENIHIRTKLPTLDWESVHRIDQLAQMRNAGMQPFYDSLPTGLSPDGHPWTGIVYYNDVYLSATHFLELMHQHFKQDADMTCGWDHAGRWFYDGWVGRDMSGDLYTPFPVKEEDKDLPQKLFPSSPYTLERYKRMLPFQVFAGWNGITVLSPTPFLPPYNVRFRRGKPRTDDFWECQASESSFISWDFWKYGFGRIAVIPGVHATYGKEDAMLRGWVEWPQEEPGYSELISWDNNPPPKVRCHDWPDKPGKGYWAWDTVRWVDPPKLEVPK
ncbi:hypothetical protein CI109_105371 [Kwoniella shandongensis]|uniref:Uncharacterized protein n=1 Tax=Kwoniella shandongensis TaxID=1734106 RepID=A0A5M6BRD5_9TREE|nr:uncharacterized protein CI109_006332 [Kwoniella shandongensis]KAA5525353.1 hypothetical protein CI109_006332 [Kwoniella shandongensis]